MEYDNLVLYLKGEKRMKRWLALFLVFVMMLSLTACGGSNDPDDVDTGDDVEDPGDVVDPGDDPGDTGSGIEGEFYSFESENDSPYVVFDFFKELDYTLTTQSADGTTTAFDLSYTFSGDDSELDARKFELILVEDGEEKVFETWINDAGECVKAGVDGEYLTGEMASLTTMGFVFHLIWVTAYTEGFSEAFIENDFEGYGWTVEESTAGTQDFGAGNVPVHFYRFKYSWLSEEVVYEWEVANIGGKNMFTKWKMAIGEDIVEMNVNRIIPF